MQREEVEVEREGVGKQGRGGEGEEQTGSVAALLLIIGSVAVQLSIESAAELLYMNTCEYIAWHKYTLHICGNIYTHISALMRMRSFRKGFEPPE